MWEKKRPETVIKPDTTPPAPILPVARISEPARRGTTLGNGISIVGDVYSEEDIFIDGDVQGQLEVKDGNLTIGPQGRARSNVRAREVMILGKVQGDVEASQKITIRSQGSLVGNIRTTGIVIDDEAYFKGSIEIVQKPNANPKVA